MFLLSQTMHVHHLPPLSPGARTHPAPTDVSGSSTHLPSASPLTPSPTLGQHHPSSHSPSASAGAASALGQHHSSPLSPAAHDQPLTQVNSPPIGHSQALSRSPHSPAAHGQPPNHTPLSSATHGQPKKLRLHGPSGSTVSPAAPAPESEVSRARVVITCTTNLYYLSLSYV